MKGLLIKDFSLLLQQKKFLVILLLLSVFLNYNSSVSDGTFAIGYLTFVCAFLILNSITYDEHENGYSFLFTLPIMRKTYVRSKYLFTLLICTVSWFLGIMISVACFIAKNQLGKMPETMEGAEIILSLGLIFLAVMLPLQLKFGAEKSKIAIAVAFGICFLIGYLVVTATETSGVKLWIIETLQKQSKWLIEAAVWIGTIAIMGISYFISTVVMKQKEF